MRLKNEAVEKAIQLLTNDPLNGVVVKESNADLVEVVRCRDCESWAENEHCIAWAYEYSDADGYCYLGKRREDETN